MTNLGFHNWQRKKGIWQFVNVKLRLTHSAPEGASQAETINKKAVKHTKLQWQLLQGSC